MQGLVMRRAKGQNQDDVTGFLSRPESYGLRDGTVERVETHCSIVFLAGDRAYKLKRAIRYGDADYTALAKRHAACNAELVLNRRTAPLLYLSVAAICRAPGGALAFNGPGVALDYAVVMRRFAQEYLFDRMADEGRLTPGLMRALGGEIAQFHNQAAPRPAYGGNAAIKRAMADIGRELSRHAGLLGQTRLSLLRQSLRAALLRVAPLLNQRRRAGKVRRCHGDLRLANICLWQGRPTLFDAAEFSEKAGSIDILYDLAFVLMDLRLRGLEPCAAALLDAYLTHTPDEDTPALLPLFLALRASMRAYTLADSAGRQHSPAQAAQKRAQAQLHLRAAIGFVHPHGEAHHALQ